MCLNLFGKYLKSLNGYLLERPPVSIFMLFILGLAINFLILASNIQQNQYAIDYEASKDYKFLIDRVQKIQFCTTRHTNQYNSTEQQNILNQHGETTFVNISFPIQAALQVIGNMSESEFPVNTFTSIIPYYLVLKTDDHVHNIGAQVFLDEAFFPEDLSRYPASRTLKSYDGCLVLTVKRDALPSELPYDLCKKTGFKEGGSFSTLHMTSSVERSSNLMNPKNPPSIMDGVYMSLKTKPHFQPVVYLNLIDRELISGRLNITSYVLFVILVTCILYAIMRGTALMEYKKVTQS